MKLLSNPKKNMAAWPLLTEGSFIIPAPNVSNQICQFFFRAKMTEATNFKEKSKKAAMGWIGKKRNFRENASQEDLQLQRSATQK